MGTYECLYARPDLIEVHALLNDLVVLGRIFQGHRLLEELCVRSTLLHGTQHPQQRLALFPTLLLRRKLVLRAVRYKKEYLNDALVAQT